MVHDLQDQIHSLFETGLLPVTAADITHQDRPATTPFPFSARSPVTVRRVTTVIVGLAAAACAVALAVTQLGGVPAARARPAGPAWPAVIDEAYVRHVAAASRLALARSGQVVITSTDTEDHRQTMSTWHLTYSSANWSDSSTYSATVRGKLRVLVSSSFRVVDGQAYDYHGRAWYHVTGPHAGTSMHVADARALLAELAPSARFVRAGTAVVDGVRVEHLRATALDSLPVISVMGYLQLRHYPYGHITALDVWVDGHDVVRRITWSSDSPTWFNSVFDGHAQHVISYGGHMDESVVVTFRAIGHPQLITVPPNAIPERSPG